MKRSKALSLLLMGSLSIGVSGCSSERSDEGMYTFTSIDECVTSALFSEAECQDMARSALAERPRFSNLEECEAQFGEGACENGGALVGGLRPMPGMPVTGMSAPGEMLGDAPEGQGEVGQDGTTVQRHSGGLWMPMMMGYMAGRFMSGGRMMRGSEGLYRDPAARSGSGASYRTGGGETVKPGPGGRVASPSQRMTQSMAHRAKPAMGRSGSGKRGGFSGGSLFGGASS